MAGRVIYSKISKIYNYTCLFTSIIQSCVHGYIKFGEKSRRFLYNERDLVVANCSCREHRCWSEIIKS